MRNIYTSEEYLATTKTWHIEDSPWKADQIHKIIERNNLSPKLIAEIGCGAGAILHELSKKPSLKDTEFYGYDISPHAIELCKKIDSDKVHFQCADLLDEEVDKKKFDILLVIDVFEHVPDYLGFIEKCVKLAKYTIFHIPLDLHASSILRASFIHNRYTIGHIHYFTEESAVATLHDSGSVIVDSFLTNGAIGLAKHHPSLKRSIANIPRRALSLFSHKWSARLLGGYSLLALTKESTAKQD